MARKVASFIDLKDSDNIDDLPIFQKVLALIFSSNKNRQREAIRKEEVLKMEKISKLETFLDSYLKHCISKAENKKQNSVTIEIDREFFHVVDTVINKPYYNMYNIEFIERNKFYNVKSNTVIRITRRIVNEKE